MKPMPGSIAQPIRILLIDDQVIVREGLRLLLESQTGLHVVADAASCKEAVALAQAEQPDVILLDINMPVMDGWDFLEWFKEYKSHFPKPISIFMVSSSIDRRDIEKAKSYAEVKDYISKPLTDRSFFEIVDRKSVV